MTDPRRIDAIIRAVCAEFHVTRDLLLGNRRVNRVIPPRMALAHAMRELTDLSTVEIGVIMHRDHSSVIHGSNGGRGVNSRPAWMAEKLNAIALRLPPPPDPNDVYLRMSELANANGHHAPMQCGIELFGDNGQAI
jgi:hypothetical protein